MENMTIIIMIKWIILTGLASLFLLLLVLRIWITLKYPESKQEEEWAYNQTTGNKEIQADCVQIYKNRAGTMAVMADGIGRENTGAISARVATDAVLDAFEPYHILENPEYLFRTAFIDAHNKVQITIGDRRGGACMGAAFIKGKTLYYAIAGNIRIALFRNGELIPLSKGHTMEALAREAYREGQLSRQNTIWSLGDNQVWNYLGMDGFHDIEISKPPVALRAGDLILMASRGIYDEVSWIEMEEILNEDMTIRDKTERMIQETEKADTQEKENGSILLIAAGT